MGFISIDFFLLVISSVALLWLEPALWFRKFLILFVSFIFVFSYLSSETGLVFSAFILISYACVYLSKILHQNRYLLSIALGFTLFFILSRYYFGAAGVVGFSYIFFRVIMIIFDSKIKRIGFLHVISYLIYYPALASGPLQNYSEFKNDIEFFEKPKPDELISISFRAIWGFLKVAIAGPFLLQMTDLLNSNSLDFSKLAFGFALAPAAIYINFSGYMDLAISISRLNGIRLPENFNFPFLSQNPIEFWNRWHITVSKWFSDFVFYPSYTWLKETFPVEKEVRFWWAITAALLTFLMMGWWHGSEANFLLGGFTRGAGVMLVIFIFRSKRFVEPQSFFKKMLLRTSTFLYFAVGWIFFRYSLPELDTIFQRFDMFQVAQAILIAPLMVVSFLLAHDLVIHGGTRIILRFWQLKRSAQWAIFVLVILLVTIAVSSFELLPNDKQLTESIYKAF